LIVSKWLFASMNPNVLCLMGVGRPGEDWGDTVGGVGGPEKAENVDPVYMVEAVEGLLAGVSGELGR
jgi:hypothetical protein